MLCRRAFPLPALPAMNHQDFVIGQTFWCGGNRWRCTDIGTRVITAISLEPCEMVRFTPEPEHPDGGTRTTYLCDEAWRLSGPPYGIVEHVFDEYSLPACSLTPKDG